MRVTQSMYYKNLYGTNNSQINSKLFDVNKQIASGIKIQYASDDVSTFAETMRLDNEITILEQVKKSTDSGYKTSNQTDLTLGEIENNMQRMRTLLLQAANDTNSDASLDAIAAELRASESQLKGLANTSINGKFLFSGSAVGTKPISDNGIYNGNDVDMNAFLGSNSTQTYNITGSDLFLGEETLIRREVSTNMLARMNNPPAGTVDSNVSANNTMLEFMGDSPSGNHYFYVRGTQSDGTAISSKITMTDTETVGSLLNKIGIEYGNTGNTTVVNVSLNDHGQIVIQDRIKGSSKLDFHIVGATDFSGGVAADVTNIDLLDSGSTDYATAFGGSSLYIREFVKSPYSSSTAGITNISGLLYDRTNFTKEGNIVSSNVSQIEKTTNAFATPSTKILDVASGTTLDGQQFAFTGTDVNGVAFTAQIDFANAGSTFSLDAGVTNYSIFDVGTTRAAVDADEMTYQQLMDVMNMIATDNLPASVNTDTDYDTALISSNSLGTTSLSYDGKIQFHDLNSDSTNVELSLYDSTSGDFSAASNASVISFNTNNALTVRDAKTDFFKTINDMIVAVENKKLYPNYDIGDERNVGIENAIALMDDLQDHMFRIHSLAGSYSNSLTLSLERTETLSISTKTLRSEVIDTDLAEASLKLTQLTLNYEAMLSTVGRVSQLSLVNYL